MNKIHTIAMFAIVFGVALSPIILSHDAEARVADTRYILQGDLTAPSNDKPFGGDTIGTYSVHVTDDYTYITAELTNGPSRAMVYEGWLVDVETGEKLSTGLFDDGRYDNRAFFFLNDAEFHYDVFVITEEPVKDLDPTPSLPPVGAVPLGLPFGQ